MANDDVVLYEVQDGVALITLNRPDRMNAWTGEMEDRYFDLLERAEADGAVRAVVVTGAGRGFCPGADMDLLQEIGGSGGGGGGAVGERRPVTMPLSVRKPLVGAINGACAGVGLVQALMFDVRFAAAGARMTTAFARRGLIAEYGVSWLLPRLVGTSRALDLLVSARVFTAEEALELGLVNQVRPADEVVDAAMAYARDLAASCSPASMAAIKHQVYAHASVDIATALAQSDGYMRQSLRGPDFKEGVASYLEKRLPAFAPLGEGTEIDLAGPA